MAEKETTDVEPGRSKHAATPREHLMHLLNIGWNPRSPLIVKFATEHGLTRDLEETARAMSKAP
jgi:hypothetical protein